MHLSPGPGDALIVVDMQVDFVTGALAVPDARSIVPAVHRYVRLFERRGLPVFASRDWHPGHHVSFKARGGPWPAHCIQGTPGAEFCDGLVLGPEAQVISKGMRPDRDAYSAFEDTDLDARLRRSGIHRLFVCGLAAEYCVRATVADALRLGYQVFVLADAIRAVEPDAESACHAARAMRVLGAVFVELEPAGEEAHG